VAGGGGRGDLWGQGEAEKEGGVLGVSLGSFTVRGTRSRRRSRKSIPSFLRLGGGGLRS